MIKYIPCCDYCGKEMSESEYRRQAYYGEQAGKVWTYPAGFVVCKDCANKIDNAVLQLRKEVEIDKRMEIAKREGLL